jgi:hypothetical protein
LNEYAESLNPYDLAFLDWKYVKNTQVCQLHSWYRKIGLFINFGANPISKFTKKIKFGLSAFLFSLARCFGMESQICVSSGMSLGGACLAKINEGITCEGLKWELTEKKINVN